MIAGQILFDMLSYASVLLLIVIGLAIVVNMMGIFNFAHGEFVLMGAYIHWLFIETGWSPWLGIAVAPAAVGALAMVLEITVIRRFYATPVAAMFGTYALGQILRETLRWAIGGVYHAVPEPVQGTWVLAGVTMPYWRLLLIAVALIVLSASVLILGRSLLGLRARAALENPLLARASGMSTGRIYMATFATGAALAGLAGALIVPIYALSADLGMRFLIQSFLAILLGGPEMIAGAMAGAGSIGGLSAALPWIIPPMISEILLVIIALTIIRLRPQGLLRRDR